MYAAVMRRRMVPERITETRERAEQEFFPVLEQAPGFVSFTLVQSASGVTTAVALWEDQAQAEAFVAGAGGQWMQALDAFGHQLETREGGEVIAYRTAKAAVREP